MLINMAVDSGYGYLMGKCGLGEVKMPSYIEEISKVDLQETINRIDKVDSNNVLVKYNERYYAVGKLATKVNPNVIRSLSNIRVRNDEHLVGILAVMGLLYQSNTSFEVNLGVGLPEKLIREADELEKWLSSKFEFSFVTKDKEYKKAITIKETICMNQGIAPIYLLNNEELNKNIISIDLGHNTYHCVLWRDKQVPLQYRTDGDGMKTCYIDLEKRLRSANNMPVRITTVSQLELEKAIETGLFKRNKKSINISSELEEIFETKAKNLFKTIENTYGDILTSVDIILVNGGAMQNEIFVEKLGEKFSKLYDIEFIVFDESQWSVTRGMYKYVSQVFEDDLGEEIEEIAVTDENIEDNVGEDIGE